MADMRTFLPMLPPELRNEVYSYLSAHETSTASNAGLPLQLKNYSCKHTLVQICPVHSGSTGLLALRHHNFLEAHEYQTWLLNNAVTLRLGVVFKGRVNTFVQEHWDKKIEAHLQKLAKQHLWLKKVAKYDIQILWDAPDGVLKSKNNRRTAGQIPRAMTRTLTTLMDEDARKKQGNVSVKLRLEHHVAGVAIRSAPRFGLGSFMALATDFGCRSQTREIWKESCPRILPRKSARLTPVVKYEEKELLKFEHGRVAWIDRGQGTLLMKKIAISEKTTCASFMDTGIAYDSPTEFMLLELLEDCYGRR
ncbi:hypothetical protein EKO04_003014 [Ascochyta lentis]|uniref:Uncharacterized protein n=1 Tax=Ascochyta lentis TaxID=205686 RepID=A0A8H7JAJ5_9PLEO|nr:hypothetical protein EKO04_003014 [Ascochyta lentis]